MTRMITKTVIKTMCITLLSLFGVGILFLLFLSFVAPSAMARLTRDLGMYPQSAWYSSLQYADGKGDIDNIAAAFNCSVLARDEENIVKYGKTFIEDARFKEYCEEVEAREAQEGTPLEAYTQYVYGRVGIAYYRIDRGEQGLTLALSVNTDSFVEYNAVNDLANEVVLKGDAAFAAQILTSLTSLQASGAITESGYLDRTVNILITFTAQN